MNDYYPNNLRYFRHDPVCARVLEALHEEQHRRAAAAHEAAKQEASTKPLSLKHRKVPAHHPNDVMRLLLDGITLGLPNVGLHNIALVLKCGNNKGTGGIGDDRSDFIKRDPRLLLVKDVNFAPRVAADRDCFEPPFIDWASDCAVNEVVSKSPKFKVGDRVRIDCRSALYFGKHGLIVGVSSAAPNRFVVDVEAAPNRFVVDVEDGTAIGCVYNASWLTKVDDACKFKVGDRVRIDDPNAFYRGFLGRVVGASNDGRYVDVQVEAANDKATYTYPYLVSSVTKLPDPPTPTFKVGDRVRIDLPTSKFRGSCGTVVATYTDLAVEADAVDVRPDGLGHVNMSYVYESSDLTKVG